MNNADTYLPYLLGQYKRLEEEQRKEVEGLPQGQLSVRAVGENVNYVQLLPVDSAKKRVRRGISRDENLIQALARKKYLQKSLKILEKDISALETLVAVHKAPTPDNIMPELRRTFTQLPDEVFLPQIKETDQWVSADFEQSTYKPEEKTHITANGERVRSKSEVIIADRLDAHRIPYRYEQMLYIENHAFSPDFTILCNGELVYWEHCGLVSNPAYMQRHAWKLSMYEKAGIVPWKNLIVTYDDENGNLNSRIIEAEIACKLLT